MYKLFSYFRCALKNADYKLRNLKKLELYVCNIFDAGSDTHQLQITFCNDTYKTEDRRCALDDNCTDYQKNSEGKLFGKTLQLNTKIRNSCCRTNDFGWYNTNDGSAFWTGKPEVVSGEENLGSCEGHNLVGENFYIYGR